MTPPATFVADLERVRFEQLVEVLCDPNLGRQYLSAEEVVEYERCQQSIVDAAIWVRP